MKVIARCLEPCEPIRSDVGGEAGARAKFESTDGRQLFGSDKVWRAAEASKTSKSQSSQAKMLAMIEQSQEQFN